MPIAEAQIATGRASRYLGQLCGHLEQMSRMRHQTPAGHGGHAPPAIEHVESSGGIGTIRFARGSCILQANSDTLTVRIDADDQDSLRQLQQAMAQRLDTIGRRDNLTVQWRQSEQG